jgi:hypothetical protein
LNTDLSAFLALILSLSSFSTNKWKFMTHKWIFKHWIILVCTWRIFPLLHIL